MIGVDIGGSHITSLHIEDISRGKYFKHLNSDSITIRDRTKNQILDDWAEHLNECIRECAHFDGHIAVAFPGPFDYELGIVHSHPNGKFQPLENINIGAELKRRIDGCENIHFENDAACFGIGEYHFGEINDETRVIAITIGSGIGSTFIDNGKVIKNRSDVPEGGEVYYLPFFDQSADDYFSTRWFVSSAAYKNIEIEGVKELLQIEERDIVENIFRHFFAEFC